MNDQIEVAIKDFEPSTYNDARVKYFSTENIPVGRIETSSNVLTFMALHDKWPLLLDMNKPLLEVDEHGCACAGRIFGADWYLNVELDNCGEDIGIIKLFGYKSDKTLKLMTRLPKPDPEKLAELMSSNGEQT